MWLDCESCIGKSDLLIAVLNAEITQKSIVPDVLDCEIKRGAFELPTTEIKMGHSYACSFTEKGMLSISQHCHADSCVHKLSRKISPMRIST